MLDPLRGRGREREVFKPLMSLFMRLDMHNVHMEESEEDARCCLQHSPRYSLEIGSLNETEAHYFS